MRKNKYGAKKTIVDGITFDSKRESNRWGELKMLERGGVISELTRQVTLYLNGMHGPILTPTGRKMRYVADFTYVENGVLIIEDTKGFATDVYKLKKAILAAQGIYIKES